jgi:hypothetical protein
LLFSVSSYSQTTNPPAAPDPTPAASGEGGELQQVRGTLAFRRHFSPDLNFSTHKGLLQKISKSSGERGMTTLVLDESSLRAVQVQVTKEALVVDLFDGRSVSVPLVWYPRLVQASAEERQQFRLIGSGEGIHWDLLDEDISVEGIVVGRRSMESPESFRRWLDSKKERDLVE